jgi:hypothetical protein
VATCPEEAQEPAPGSSPHRSSDGLQWGHPSAPISHTDATYARAPAALATGAPIFTANPKVRVSVIWLPERNPSRTSLQPSLS